MPYEPDRKLTTGEKRGARAAVIGIIFITAILLFLTCRGLLYRSATFIILYTAIIIICLILLFTALRGTGTDETKTQKRSEEQIIADAKLAMEIRKQEQAEQAEKATTLPTAETKALENTPAANADATAADKVPAGKESAVAADTEPAADTATAGKESAAADAKNATGEDTTA